VTLHSRNGYDFADRFPVATAAVAALRARSCRIDGAARLESIAQPGGICLSEDTYR
jgi:ATP-dependent DNA ligase